MEDTPHSRDDRRLRLIIAALATTLAAFLFTDFFIVLDLGDHVRSVLAGDVNLYELLGTDLLAGLLPYTELAIEHLPVAVIPIWILTWVATVLGVSLAVVWVPVMALCFIASVVLMDSIPTEHRVGYRYLAVAAPLLPLVLFRLEVWVGLFVVLAMVAYATHRVTRGAAWTIVAALGKGWPIVLVAYPWKAGRRWLTVGVVAVSTTLLAMVAFTEGFREGRAFEGIHSETIVGNLIIVWRSLTSNGIGLENTAGAVYVTAPAWVVLVNAIPGLIVVGLALYAFTKRDSDFRNLTLIVGLAALGIILMSPLFSTQFIFWLAPFVAFAAIGTRKAYIAAACIGLATLTVFQPEALWWNLVVLAKNVAIVWLAIVWTRRVLAFPQLQPESTSRKNLPV